MATQLIHERKDEILVIDTDSLLWKEVSINNLIFLFSVRCQDAFHRGFVKLWGECGGTKEEGAGPPHSPHAAAQGTIP